MPRRAACLAAVTSLILSGALGGSSAHAATYAVTSAADSGAGTLREAMVAANATPEADTISIAPMTIQLTSALPDITSEMTIEGTAASQVIVRRQVGAYRVFTVASGATHVTLRSLTVSNGSSQTFGGGIFAQAPLVLDHVIVSGNFANRGGGLALQGAGDVTVTDSRFSGNSAQEGPGGAAFGGGVYAESSALHVTASTFDGNSAQGPLTPAEGGAIAATGGPTSSLLLEHSTISGNTADTGGGLAIHAATAEIADSTIAGNTANPGANVLAPQPLKIHGTILADPLSGANCAPTGIAHQDEGYNVVEDTTCGAPTALDRFVVDVQLGTLADNGGPTPTRALPATSPAVDAGNATDTDQRGETRVDAPGIANTPGGTGADAGAYELQDSTPPDTSLLADLSSPTHPTFTFSASVAEPNVTYRCTLDGDEPFGCQSPYEISQVGGGEHTFTVAAIDGFGNADPSPESATWTVVGTTVTSSADSGPGTLRQALHDFNLGITPSPILIGSMTIDLLSPLPQTSHPVSIQGAGADRTTVERSPSATASFRVFTMGSADMELRSMTIAHGRSGAGGGILTFSNSLVLDRVVVANNEVVDGLPADVSQLAGRGGGLAVGTAPATIRRSRFTGNSVVSDGAERGGGAVASYNGDLTITDSTFDGNSATGVTQHSTMGGAILTLNGDLLMRRSTVSGNVAEGVGGGLQLGVAGNPFAQIYDSTIAGNTAPQAMSISTLPGDTQVTGSVLGGSCNVGLAATYSVTDDASCFSAATTNKVVGDLRLRPLADNGGPTPTRALLPDSPAIDAGNSTDPDQRTKRRPVDDPDIADAAGGNAADAGAFEVQDFTAPQTQLLTHPDSTVATGNATFTFSSDKSPVTFSCTLDGGAASACTSPHTSPGLADGQHTFTVAAADSEGNSDASSASFTWTVDTTGPDTSIDDGPPVRSSSSAARFAFSSPEAGATFTCRLDGAASAPCSPPVDYTGMADGDHTVAVAAVDALGNADPTPATRTWSVDTTPPPTAIDSGPDGTTSATDAAFTFSSGEAGVTFRCKLDAEPYAPCSASASYSALAVGDHTFSVFAVDAVGNEDSSPASRTWTIAALGQADTTPPNTRIVKPPRRTHSRRPRFSFRASEARSTFQCKIDRGRFRPCRSRARLAALKPGKHELRVRAVDRAGNVDPTPARWKFRIVR